MTWLHNHFGDQVISRKTVFEWAACSPDLSPLDFYLWGYLKDRVYEGNPQDIEELKAAVVDKIHHISLGECRRVVGNFVHRLRVCLERRGRNFGACSLNSASEKSFYLNSIPLCDIVIY